MTTKRRPRAQSCAARPCPPGERPGDHTSVEPDDASGKDGPIEAVPVAMIDAHRWASRKYGPGVALRQEMTITDDGVRVLRRLGRVLPNGEFLEVAASLTWSGLVAISPDKIGGAR